MELAKAKKLWSETQTIKDVEFSLRLRSADYQQAVREMPGVGPLAQAYIKVRLDPSEANVQAMMTALRRDYSVPRAVMAMQALGEMDRAEDFHAFVLRPGSPRACAATLMSSCVLGWRQSGATRDCSS